MMMIMIKSEIKFHGLINFVILMMNIDSITLKI